jgi:hypothetical protein
MEVPKIKLNTMKPGDFFGKLFQLRDEIHLNHLKITGPGSFAAHSALNGFYSDVLDLIDSLVESYQGKYGIIEIVISNTKSGDSIKCLEELVKLTDGGSAYSMFTETWIQNQIDEISTLTYSTLYKLKNLK